MFNFPYNGLWAFIKDRDGNLWVGSATGGLYYCKPNGSIIKTYNTNNGLPDNRIQAIVEDNQGNIWVSSLGGIGRLDHKTHDFRIYAKEDGLQSDQFFQQSFLKTRDGDIYFGGYNGFNSFNPSSIKDNQVIPPVYLSDFQIFNKPVIYAVPGSQFQTQISEAKEISISWQQSVFSFGFLAINYRHPEKNKYAYIMEGFEKEWNFTNASRRYVTYTNLDPGTYTFRVKASNNDGVWNEKGVSLKINILPPWWRTWWFKLIVSLIILVCISFFILKIVNRINRLANQTIFNERNQLKTLINNIPDRVIIKDTKSRFLIVNDATVKYFGRKSASEFINKTDYDIHPKELADEFFKQELGILDAGMPLINKEEKRIVNNEEFFVSTTKCPIINVKGETIGLVCITKDITSQKKAEFELITQSEELKKFNIVLSETNALMEERQQQIEEQSEELKVTNEKLLEKQCKIEEQAEELRVHSENLKDINDILVEKQHFILKQSEVLTEKNKELSFINATKDRFFSIIAHDLRNPFNVVSGFSEVILTKDNLPAEKVRKYIELIHKSSTNGSVLLENLLQWARSQTGRIAFEPVKLNLLSFVEETFLLLEGGAVSKKIHLQNNIDPNTFILADDNMIKTILRNLISNAIKFTDENGNIILNSEIQGEFVEISVTDSGMGISPELMEQLFKIDVIVTNKGTAQESGTGLGLILCKDFVERHNGKIYVESQLNKGSCFKFTIPLA